MFTIVLRLISLTLTLLFIANITLAVFITLAIWCVWTLYHQESNYAPQLLFSKESRG